MIRYKLLGIMALMSIAVLLVSVACGDSGAPEGGAAAEVEQAAEEEEVAPGVVQAKPAGATQVDVTLNEWGVAPSVDSVSAGQIYFLAENIGPVDPHELVIVKSDLSPEALPFIESEGLVDETQVEIIGEIEEFAPNSSASGVFDLAPGNYVLICNIAEIEDGVLERHYQLGMYRAFRVN